MIVDSGVYYTSQKHTRTHTHTRVGGALVSYIPVVGAYGGEGHAQFSGSAAVQ